MHGSYYFTGQNNSTIHFKPIPDIGEMTNENEKETVKAGTYTLILADEFVDGFEYFYKRIK